MRDLIAAGQRLQKRRGGRSPARRQHRPRRGLHEPQPDPVQPEHVLDHHPPHRAEMLAALAVDHLLDQPPPARHRAHDHLLRLDPLPTHRYERQPPQRRQREAGHHLRPRVHPLAFAQLRSPRQPQNQSGPDHQQRGHHADPEHSIAGHVKDQILAVPTVLPHRHPRREGEHTERGHWNSVEKPADHPCPGRAGYGRRSAQVNARSIPKLVRRRALQPPSRAKLSPNASERTNLPRMVPRRRCRR